MGRNGSSNGSDEDDYPHPPGTKGDDFAEQTQTPILALSDVLESLAYHLKRATEDQPGTLSPDQAQPSVHAIYRTLAIILVKTTAERGGKYDLEATAQFLATVALFEKMRGSEEGLDDIISTIGARALALAEAAESEK